MLNSFGSISPLDYIVVAAYFTIIIFVGVVFSKYVKQAKDYFAAGAAVPWWLAGVSLWMASFSALMFVVYSQLAYKYGFVAITFTWVAVPAMILAAFFFSGRWRRTRVMTPLGFMEQRYNSFVHQIFVWTGIPLRLIDNSIKIYSTAVFMVVAVGQSWFTLGMCIGLVGIIMILYTILGGQWAVIVTDFIQFIILVFAVLILLPLSLISVGGIGGFIEKSPAGFFNFFSAMNQPYNFFDWLMFAVIIGISYNATWSLVQKYNCVATETDAKKVAILMGVLSFVGPLVFFIPAMSGRILLPDLTSNGDLTKYTYVLVCLKLLPAGVMGLMVSAIFSATLSTLGSEYNVLSGVLTKDFYGKMINPHADEKKLVLWGRINTFLIGTITIFVAFGIDFIKGYNIYDIMNKAVGALGPAIMLPLLGGLFFRKINSKGAISGVLFGTLTGIGLVLLNVLLLSIYKDRLADDATLSYWLKQGYNSISIGVNLIVTLLGMWIGSSLTKAPADEQKRVEEFFSRMSIPTDAKIEKVKDSRRSPFYAVGIASMSLSSVVIIIGAILYFMGDSRAFLIDGVSGGLMFLVGFALWFGTLKR